MQLLYILPLATLAVAQFHFIPSSLRFPPPTEKAIDFPPPTEKAINFPPPTEKAINLPPPTKAFNFPPPTEAIRAPEESPPRNRSSLAGLASFFPDTNKITVTCVGPDGLVLTVGIPKGTPEADASN